MLLHPQDHGKIIQGMLKFTFVYTQKAIIFEQIVENCLEDIETKVKKGREQCWGLTQHITSLP